MEFRSGLSYACLSLGRINFGISLAEFTKARKAGEFDDDQEKNGVSSVWRQCSPIYHLQRGVP
ncbi:MAG: hypothetical protein OXC95_12985, partial [Dehalococcoidia bacterium]|nr:hypothetical protein [Dehalococcoidia bacterium]